MPLDYSRVLDKSRTEIREYSRMEDVTLRYALAGVTGRRACIQPKELDTWRVIPYLWGCIGGHQAP